MDVTKMMTDPDQLARLIDLCEERVGDGWEADPTVDVEPLEHGGPQPAQDHRGKPSEKPTTAEWMNLGNRAARRLYLLLNEECA